MKISLKEAQKKIQSSDQLFLKLFAHGSMTIEIYEPKTEDLQQPHEQDEIYVIAKGTSDFVNNGVESNAQEGDLLFVRAGHEHRFYNFSNDFSTWVIFYGPKGGEKSV